MDAELKIWRAHCEVTHGFLMAREVVIVEGSATMFYKNKANNHMVFIFQFVNVVYHID